ncbi:MAG: long-chain fatty acid--CoA ligase [Desulfobacteraceae bacterium]|jgi:long-chain acyl-CoA synthetase
MLSATITYTDKPWLKHYDKDVPHSISYEKICLPEKLESIANKYPEKTALIFMGYKVSYRELVVMRDRFATCLADFGIQKGDRVAILLPNIIPCVVAYCAILKIGGIVVMNNPLYTDRELEHQFNDSGSKVLVTLDLLATRMVNLRPKTSIKQIVYSSIGDYLPFPKNLLFPLVAKKKKMAADVAPGDSLFKWKDIIAKYPPNPPKVAVTHDDIAMLQYTGGTTGVSKGVMLSHGNLFKQYQVLKTWNTMVKEGDNEVMLGALPFFHIFGISCSMNLAMCAGWTTVLVPKPQPKELLETMRKFRPTFAPLVPTMLIGMINHEDMAKTDLSCIKGCFSGSAPLPVEIMKTFAEKTGTNISEGFGMTESSPVTHSNPFKGLRKIGSIGVPVPDTDCRIVSLDDGETDMPVGETGELVIKGPQVMQGYWNRPDATRDTVKDGWLFTGDIARMDEDGYFYIVDRKKDMIISGGYNVYPRDIDEVFYEHPKVEEACAIGIPHDVRGEQVKVFVVLKAGQTATEQELIEFCKDKLAKYKLPTSIEFRDQLPKSTVGKILRKELRKDTK